MTTTQLLWRLVSVCLCVAVVCWSCGCHVGCTESNTEAPGIASLQDDSPVEESEEKTHQKDEESWALPDQLVSENEQLTDYDHPEEDSIAQDAAQKHHTETIKAEEYAAEMLQGADTDISQTEQSSEYQNPETSVPKDQDSAQQPALADSVIPAADKEDPPILGVQEDIPDSDPSAAPDVAAPEAVDPELLPSDCVDEEEDNPYDNDSPPLVLENTSNAHTAGTKIHPEPVLSPPSVPSSKTLESNASHMLKEVKQDLGSPVATDTDPSVTRDPEDIPTFDEWKAKEVEKHKTLSTHTYNNGGSHRVKKVQKNFNNYASVECGAKILGANPDAKSTSAILKENMDLYMLNPCSNKIWFIIELCEPIQVKQLDIANFELFSSTPKDFLVSISDRYPTNKWLKLGTFHARDERTVQSFPLDEQLYAKYVKVELVSHFGSEHFCPLSLIRVFGTSMVEEYEEIADPSERQDDQDDDLDYPSPGEANLSKNLIGSAKDAILNMVKDIAVNVLGRSSEMKGNLSSQEVNTTEPSQQPETSSDTVTTDLTPVPDGEDVQVLPDPGVPPTEAPSVEIPSPETDTTDGTEGKLPPPPPEETIVIPLDKEEEEPISSSITLLDKEEEVDDGKEKKNSEEQQRPGGRSYCSPPSSSCSCAASLQEYVQRQSSASLSQKRKCQAVDGKQKDPLIQTPTRHKPPPSSTSTEPPPQETGAQQPPEKEPASDQEPERQAVVSEDKQLPDEPASEPPPLEPSQTVNLPQPSVSEETSATPTPVVEMPPPASEAPAEEPGPSKSQPEEKPPQPSTSLGSSAQIQPTATVPGDGPSAEPPEEKPSVEIPHPEVDPSIQTQDKTDQLPEGPSVETQAEPPVVPEGGPAPTEVPSPLPEAVTETEPPGGHVTGVEDLAEDASPSSGGNGQPFRPSSPTPPSAASSSLSDIYAEPFNGTEPNGNPVPSSSQKESVFMRLNNRIKALEVNMSLSGRYLEQLSQRYRKQMEEMQRAFNKTIIKLQNTSRIAEEQDLRQTESIQLLQGQLENVTQLVLNLSVRVSQLHSEVADRQNYLLLSLALCLCLGLLLCVNHCRITVPPASEPEPPPPKSYTYCCPERQFTSCDETGLKRSASYPLIHSESFQLATTECPDTLLAEETQSLCPANRKRRRRRVKPLDKVETLRASFQAAPKRCNGGVVVCNGGPVVTRPGPLAQRFLQPVFRDSPSEGSSEGSHSDDPSFCGITTACSRICDGLPPPKTRAERRALRRRRPKPRCALVELLHDPHRDKNQTLNQTLPSSITDIMNRKPEQNSGPLLALTGPV
ncbi:SUN domain-containing ossification factor-like isoform X2 [Cololabis saira]|uniref:SUN domain-containing ossification factor-like isoform X2 n=1 Tax=Cololabis saira TaxID=129043 RepID=UPI002AD1D0DF|nr:SUN domain-containing ossification factor-like isoform X2 [Cololabis saira]